MTNPVRSGNDKFELKTLINLLTSIDSKKAHNYLLFSLSLLIKKLKDEKNEIKCQEQKRKSNIISPDRFNKFLTNILAQVDSGQSLPLVIGTIFFAVLNQFDSTKELKIKIHKVNEAGSSSLEVGDIDIFESGTLITTIEAKDKIFHSADILHAARKAKQGNLNHFYFIYHIDAQNMVEDIKSIKHRCKNIIECETTIINIDQFIDFMFGLLNIIDFEKISIFIRNSMDQMNVTDSFSKRINDLIKKV